MPHTQGLGGVIRELRERRGWSLRELGRRADVDVSIISRVESGQQVGMNPENLARVAQTLGISVDRMRTDAGIADPAEVASRARRPTYQDVVESDPNLTAEQRAQLLSLYRLFTRGSSPSRSAEGSSTRRRR